MNLLLKTLYRTKRWINTGPSIQKFGNLEENMFFKKREREKLYAGGFFKCYWNPKAELFKNSVTQ